MTSDSQMSPHSLRRKRWLEPLSLRERGWGEGPAEASCTRTSQRSAQTSIARRDFDIQPFGPPSPAERRGLQRRNGRFVSERTP